MGYAKHTFQEFRPQYRVAGRSHCRPCRGAGWVAEQSHPDPENAVATCLQELGDLYAFNWPNAYGRRTTGDLAKACDEVVKWVREVKGEMLPKASRSSA